MICIGLDRDRECCLSLRCSWEFATRPFAHYSYNFRHSGAAGFTISKRRQLASGKCADVLSLAGKPVSLMDNANQNWAPNQHLGHSNGAGLGIKSTAWYKRAKDRPVKKVMATAATTVALEALCASSASRG